MDQIPIDITSLSSLKNSLLAESAHLQQQIDNAPDFSKDWISTPTHEAYATENIPFVEYRPINVNTPLKPELERFTTKRSTQPDPTSNPKVPRQVGPNKSKNTRSTICDLVTPNSSYSAPITTMASKKRNAKQEGVHKWRADVPIPSGMIVLTDEEVQSLMQGTSGLQTDLIQRFVDIANDRAEHLWNPHRELRAAHIMRFALDSLSMSAWLWQYSEIDRNLQISVFRATNAKYNLNDEELITFTGPLLPAPPPQQTTAHPPQGSGASVLAIQPILDKYDETTKSIHAGQLEMSNAMMATLRETSANFINLAAQVGHLVTARPGTSPFDLGKIQAGTSSGSFPARTDPLPVLYDPNIAGPSSAGLYRPPKRPVKPMDTDFVDW